MNPLPYPPFPTEQEIITEQRYLRLMRFATLPVILIALMLGALLIAIAISYNFNPMNWLE